MGGEGGRDEGGQVFSGVGVVVGGVGVGVGAGGVGSVW